MRGLALLETRLELLLTVREHGVEHGDRIAQISQAGGDKERAERRVGPHLFDLLDVVLQEERRGQEDVTHAIPLWLRNLEAILLLTMPPRPTACQLTGERQS